MYIYLLHMFSDVLITLHNLKTCRDSILWRSALFIPFKAFTVTESNSCLLVKQGQKSFSTHFSMIFMPALLDGHEIVSILLFSRNPYTSFLRRTEVLSCWKKYLFSKFTIIIGRTLSLKIWQSLLIENYFLQLKKIAGTQVVPSSKPSHYHIYIASCTWLHSQIEICMPSSHQGHQEKAVFRH